MFKTSVHQQRWVNITFNPLIQHPDLKEIILRGKDNIVQDSNLTFIPSRNQLPRKFRIIARSIKNKRKEQNLRQTPIPNPSIDEIKWRTASSKREKKRGESKRPSWFEILEDRPALEVSMIDVVVISERIRQARQRDQHLAIGFLLNFFRCRSSAAPLNPRFSTTSAPNTLQIFRFSWKKRGGAGDETTMLRVAIRSLDRTGAVM